MDAFRQWAMCIIVSAAAGTLVCALTPRGSADKTVRIVIGIFVVASICTPLFQIDVEEISLPVFADSYAAENESGELDDYIVSVCRSAVETEILSSASEYGVIVESIEADLYVDENKCIIIHNIHIKIQNATRDNLNDFSGTVEKELGVPVTVNAE